jgi:hypothetical protein
MAQAREDVKVEHIGPGLVNADGSSVRFLLVDDSRFAREERDMIELSEPVWLDGPRMGRLLFLNTSDSVRMSFDGH